MPRTPRQRAQSELLSDLISLQSELRDQWVDRSLPEGWQGLESTHPVRRAQTRVTLRLDEDMVKWFRRLGSGYQKRINEILRIYWTALVSGRIDSHWNEETIPQAFEQMVLRMAEESARRREETGNVARLSDAD